MYIYEIVRLCIYKVVQIWPGLIVCKQVTVCPGHILTTLYFVFYSLHLHVSVSPVTIFGVSYIRNATRVIQGGSNMTGTICV
jgi:hypothetical protein